MQVIKPNILSTVDGSFTRASSATYFDRTGALQTASTNVPRYTYDPLTGIFLGLMIEGAKTNFLLNTNSLSTQNVTVTATPYVISFYGTGSITLSGAHSQVLNSAGAFPNRRVYTFTPSAGTLTVTVSGSVQYAQLETGSLSSYIASTGSAGVRAADVVTGSGLITTTLTDATAVWSNATTYTLGQRVRYSGNIYESLQNSNLNRQPDTQAVWWVRVSPDNMHAALDNSISTVSTATTEFTLVVKPGSIDAIALLGIDAQVSEVALTDQTTGEFIWSTRVGLTTEIYYDWYQYFFAESAIARTQVVLNGWPTGYQNILVTIRLRSDVGLTVGLAQVLFGNTSTIGQLQYGVNVGIVDYSKKSADEFGNVVFVERPFSKRMSAEIFIDNSQLNRVQNFLYSIRAIPVVWVGSFDPAFEETLIVWGFYKDFSTTIAYPTSSLCSIEIEGLT